MEVNIMETKKTKEIRKVYNQCQKIFTSDLEFMDEYSKLENEEEKRFYAELYNFFLQHRQKEIIKKGLC